MCRHFRRWHHQGIYGRVTSLYSRNQLAHGWMESKQKCEQLPLALEQMQVKLDSYDGLQSKVQELEKKLKLYEMNLEDAKANNECLSRVNPLRSEQVLALFPLFGHSTYESYHI